MRRIDRQYLEIGVKWRSVPLVNCQRKTVSIRSIVGYCHYSLHKGYLTDTLMDAHDCLGKNCAFFERFDDYPYWVREANRKKEKVKRLERCQDEQARQAEQKAKNEQRFEFLRIRAQEIADANSFPIIITRVAPAASGKRNEYAINYVSDAQYNDYYPYFDLVVQLSRQVGGRYVLRHLKLPDGRYATTQDWNERRHE